MKAGLFPIFSKNSPYIDLGSLFLLVEAVSEIFKVENWPRVESPSGVIICFWKVFLSYRRLSYRVAFDYELA